MIDKFVILNGEAKANQIERIVAEENGVWGVRFRTKPHYYHYTRDRLVLIDKTRDYSAGEFFAFVDEKAILNAQKISEFRYWGKSHWRITYANGFEKDFLCNEIKVFIPSERCRKAISYLHEVAAENNFLKDNNQSSLLELMYKRVEYYNNALVLNTYLEGKNQSTSTANTEKLLFPFGCNESQEKAVTQAFLNRISVIQGPPGTGKTQTILNIIANAVYRKKNVLVVSNNNQATENVREKLSSYGFGFIVAALGSNFNKEEFIRNQPSIPTEINDWNKDNTHSKSHVFSKLGILRKFYQTKNNFAVTSSELQKIETEWKHFSSEKKICEADFSRIKLFSSAKYLRILTYYQEFTNSHETKYFEKKNFFIQRIIELFARRSLSLILVLFCWLRYGLQINIHKKISFKEYIKGSNTVSCELQTLYYLARQRELRSQKTKLEKELQKFDEKTLTNSFTQLSLSLFKEKLHNRYAGKATLLLQEIDEIKQRSAELIERYPVVLSTALSARNCLSINTVFDYVIIDEASQVSVETGALALACAKNAIIVGDNAQLPNIVDNNLKPKLETIFAKYNLPDGYDCSKNSFLHSVCKVVDNVEITLLREHYRCHPKIIEFCNQKFYAGKLIVLTQENNETNTMMVIKTNVGNHSRVVCENGNSKYNQREIDEIAQHILPQLNSESSKCVITPYRGQVNEIARQIKGIDVDTVHKYQGKEKDIVIFSAVDDQISSFADDPHLLNVAISRAKKRFILVVSGNEQQKRGNISELIDYIEYNNFAVKQSNLHSVYDYLYSQYTQQRNALLSRITWISEYASENVTLHLLRQILGERSEFSHLRVSCHVPLFNVIADTSLLTDTEKKYAQNPNTHFDFLVFNSASKRQVLAIEVDGYSYHLKGTRQNERDQMKNSICNKYNIPLLRLQTNGSNEHDRIITKLIESI